MKIPRSASRAIKSKYEILGMRDLPFPNGGRAQSL